MSANSHEDLTAAIDKATTREGLAAICQTIDREVLAGRMSMYICEFLCNRASSRFLKFNREEAVGDIASSPPLSSGKLHSR